MDRHGALSNQFDCPELTILRPFEVKFFRSVKEDTRDLYLRASGLLDGAAASANHLYRFAVSSNSINAADRAALVAIQKDAEAGSRFTFQPVQPLARGIGVHFASSIIASRVGKGFKSRCSTRAQLEPGCRVCGFRAENCARSIATVIYRALT